MFRYCPACSQPLLIPQFVQTGEQRPCPHCNATLYWRDGQFDWLEGIARRYLLLKDELPIVIRHVETILRTTTEPEHRVTREALEDALAALKYAQDKIEVALKSHNFLSPEEKLYWGGPVDK